VKENDMTKFIGIIYKDEGTNYGIAFPDFPGCVSSGDSFEQVVEMGAEALQLHIDGMTEDKEPIPTPMSFEAARAHEFAEGASAFTFIEAKPPSKLLRVNVNLDERILREIDAVSKNRSAFLTAAAQEKLRNDRR
jgi:predicted RNase H-like HicB family nuclease